MMSTSDGFEESARNMRLWKAHLTGGSEHDNVPEKDVGPKAQSSWNAPEHFQGDKKESSDIKWKIPKSSNNMEGDIVMNGLWPSNLISQQSDVQEGYEIKTGEMQLEDKEQNEFSGSESDDSVEAMINERLEKLRENIAEVKRELENSGRSERICNSNEAPSCIPPSDHLKTENSEEPSSSCRTVRDISELTPEAYGIPAFADNLHRLRTLREEAATDYRATLENLQRLLNEEVCQIQKKIVKLEPLAAAERDGGIELLEAELKRSNRGTRVRNTENKKVAHQPVNTQRLTTFQE